jgi:MFS family permease
MMLQRIGARLWIGPIMMTWGVVSACTLFVKGAWNFYAIRFLLGIVECGFFPGVILYLTYWYTQKHCARMMAIFMSAIPVSTIVASPISGWILGRMSDVGHLAAWQWLFVVEGIPSVAVGMITLFFLTDRPSEAKWLKENEKKLVILRLEEEERLKRQAGQTRHRLMDAFRSAPVWLLSLAYFGMTAGIAALTVASAFLMCQFAVFWALPTAILSGTAAAAGIAWINSIGNLAGYASPHAVGLIRDHTHSMIPALLALCGAQLVTAIMILIVARKKRKNSDIGLPSSAYDFDV